MTSRRLRQIVAVAGLAALVAIAGSAAFWNHRHQLQYETSTYRPMIGEVQLSPDGRTLKVQYTGGACDHSAKSSAAQSPTSVIVTVTVTERFPRGSSCVLVGLKRFTTIRLDQPLNERHVIDGDSKNQDPLAVLRSAS